jgi:hypothetical protein
VALLVRQMASYRPGTARTLAYPPAGRGPPSRSQRRSRATGRPAVHLHFAGVSVEDVAVIIERNRQEE